MPSSMLRHRREQSFSWRFQAIAADSGFWRDFAARVTVPQELAWRLFTKGIDRYSARAQIEIYGDCDLGEKILTLTAIVG
jgi:hypothetical protein